MVTSLTALRSSNDSNGKRVSVLATNDSSPTTTTIDFLIVGENHSVSVTLAAGETKPVETSHQKSGVGFVVVTASGSMASTSKLLDLDAASGT